MITLLALYLIAHSSTAEAKPLLVNHCYEDNREYNVRLIKILSDTDGEYRYHLMGNDFGNMGNSHEVLETIYTKEVRCPTTY